ncbi:MAG: hypothetical protein IJX12_04660 [Lachnospiraceae bacterium]|nr:hypothetical protein [Lachnospiraceae bacterium]
MYQKKSSFPVINCLVSLALVAFVAWRTYIIFTGSYKLLSYILFAFSFDLIAGIQVLLLALSIGKRDKNPELNYKPLINFNIFMLVLYGIYLVAFHVVLVITVLKVIGVLG